MTVGEVLSTIKEFEKITKKTNEIIGKMEEDSELKEHMEKNGIYQQFFLDLGRLSSIQAVELRTKLYNIEVDNF